MKPPARVAAIVTHYTHNSHADVLVSRLLQGYNLDFKPPFPNLRLASLYTDQVPAADMSRRLAREHGFPIAPTIAEALTLGGKQLAVEGVLLIGEHGNYPLSETGQIQYPRRRFFDETVATFRQVGQVVPVFLDKHLAWSEDDAHAIYQTARALNIPLLAGSSVPGTWRHPAQELRAGARLTEAIGLSFGGLEAYGYHGLEALQSIIERRRGGETGVASVQLVTGPDVWKVAAARGHDPAVFETAAAAREAKTRFTGTLRDAMNPAGFFVEYRDGLRVALFHDQGYANNEWVSAWKEVGARSAHATVHFTQEARPFGHFSFLIQGIERMIQTGKPMWPVERTLLVTGVLATAFQSHQRGGIRLATPRLGITYTPSAPWNPPSPPPPNRPIDGQ